MGDGLEFRVVERLRMDLTSVACQRSAYLLNVLVAGLHWVVFSKVLARLDRSIPLALDSLKAAS